MAEATSVEEEATLDVAATKESSSPQQQLAYSRTKSVGINVERHDEEKDKKLQ